jgi:transcriptional regulator with XRE-family HTH domain
MEGSHLPRIYDASTSEARRVDAMVAQRLEQLRVERELSQDAIADYLQCSREQVRKYLSGANRITAGKLHQLATLFEVQVSDLYCSVNGH